jgi:hypothetical protein
MKVRTVENIFKGHISVDSEPVSNRPNTIGTESSWHNLVRFRHIEEEDTKEHTFCVNVRNLEQQRAFSNRNASKGVAYTHLSRCAAKFGRKLSNHAHRMGKLGLSGAEFAVN